VYTQAGGDIRLLAPGGEVNAGLATPPKSFGIEKAADQLGIVARNVGNVDILTYDDLNVNESRVFAVNDSDIVVWSSNGDIDAGRGAKTAISAPSPVITYDRDGRANLTYSAALAGSGIQTRTSTPDQKRGDVVLAAPRGVVNAGDAGIVAGNLTIAATAVIGADNISFSGVSVGVPVDTGGLGVSLAGVTAAASSATSAATSMEAPGGSASTDAPIAEAALTWLEVFVTGLGEENCRADDEECLKRAQK
jgi:filamentous hemagglutinin